jgi:hypothetical protein
MNVHQKEQQGLRDHLRAVEERFPIRFVGLLPRGAAVHILEDEALDLLAEKLPGLTLISLTGAELDLAKRLHRPVGIVLDSELRGREREEVLSQVRPL